MDDRCQQFHEAALGTGKSKGPAKEIATLRRFLFKNQHNRFSDKAASRLFDTISIYKDPELIDDALKMPFTVFSTKQKKTMLKWQEELKGNAPSSAECSTTTTTTRLTVIECSDSQHISLMQVETGELFEAITVVDPALLSQIQKAFASTDEAVDVQAELQQDNTVTRILKLL